MITSWAFQTLTESNRTGLAGLVQYSADVEPIFIPMVLFALFMISMFASYFGMQRLRGRGDWTGSFAAAGLVTVVVATMMTMVDGLLDGATGTFALSLCYVVAIIGAIMLFSSKN